jgi:hypothetical protein
VAQAVVLYVGLGETVVGGDGVLCGEGVCAVGIADLVGFAGEAVDGEFR